MTHTRHKGKEVANAESCDSPRSTHPIYARRDKGRRNVYIERKKKERSHVTRREKRKRKKESSACASSLVVVPFPPSLACCRSRLLSASHFPLYRRHPLHTRNPYLMDSKHARLRSLSRHARQAPFNILPPPPTPPPIHISPCSFVKFAWGCSPLFVTRNLWKLLSLHPGC